MKNIALCFLLWPSLTYAGDQIQSWQELKAPKGYILSQDLAQKSCDHIWSKQIKAFKQANPKVQDPNLILVGQTLKVQSCEVPAVSSPTQNVTSLDDSDYGRGRWYLGVYTGLNFLSAKHEDTQKAGYNLGFKVGYEFYLPHEFAVGVAAGMFKNSIKTMGISALNRYQVDTNFFNIEAHLNKNISAKARVGMLVNLLAADDVSQEDVKLSHNLGAMMGLESLYELNHHLDLETNVQQRIDDLSRINFHWNIGLKYNF
jgi:hypothetical protein